MSYGTVAAICFSATTANAFGSAFVYLRFWAQTVFWNPKSPPYHKTPTNHGFFGVCFGLTQSFAAAATWA
jgi:hypothetical protein